MEKNTEKKARRKVNNQRAESDALSSRERRSPSSVTLRGPGVTLSGLEGSSSNGFVSPSSYHEVEVVLVSFRGVEVDLRREVAPRVFFREHVLRRHLRVPEVLLHVRFVHPLLRAASSSPSVNTRWPRLPMTMAVPVSWHPGRTMPAATFAFLRSSRATKRSLALASGSARMLESCCRWPGRRRCAMSVMPCRAIRVSASGSTRRTRSPKGPSCTLTC